MIICISESVINFLTGSRFNVECIFFIATSETVPDDSRPSTGEVSLDCGHVGSSVRILIQEDVVSLVPELQRPNTHCVPNLNLHQTCSKNMILIC